MSFKRVKTNKTGNLGSAICEHGKSSLEKMGFVFGFKERE